MGLLGTIFALNFVDDCADHNTIWALRHRTAEPDPRRMIASNRRPSSLVSSRTCTLSAMPQSLRDPKPETVDATPKRCRSRH
jgi:hypothetical protein